MKVIVLTRDREYPEQCKAKKHYDNVQRTSGKFLNDFLKVFYRDSVSSLFDSEETENYYRTLFQDRNFASYSTFEDFCNSEFEGEADELFYTSMVEGPLTGILPQCKPYANFIYEDYDVWFVFMNEIYELLFPSLKEPEVFLVKDNNRNGFIESICRDCGIIDANNTIVGSDNILFIHDKEFGRVGEKCLLFNGNWYDQCDKSKYEGYGKYFSTIKYFQHNGGIFERIKDLLFVLEEEIEEDRILREKTF